MGLAGAGGAAVLLLGTFAAARLFLGAAVDAHLQTARLDDERMRILERIAQSGIEVVNVTWEPDCVIDCIIDPPTSGNMSINVTNSGGEVLDAGKAHVLFDGAAQAAASFNTRLVDGAATDVWPPGLVLRLRVHIDQGEPYDDVWVIADTGATAAHRS